MQPGRSTNVWEEHNVCMIERNAGCCYEMSVATYHTVQCHNHAAQYRTALLAAYVHWSLK